MRAENRTVVVPRDDLDVVAVYAPPAEGQQDTSAYVQAQAAFDELRVEAFTRDQADEVGQRAAARLGRAAVA